MGKYCTIQTIKDMIRACVIDLNGNWDDQLPIIEVTYTTITTLASSLLLMKLFMREDSDSLSLVK